MDLPILITTSLTLICAAVILFLYIKTEKKNRLARENELSELRSLLNAVQSRVSEAENVLNQQLKEISAKATNEFTQRFETLTSNVRTAQDQANQKINSGFEQLQTENSNIQKFINHKVNEINSDFKQYAQQVEKVLSSYAQSNSEFKRDTEQLKQQIKGELQNILKEIKTPLELD
jgi:DNA anti-recombination protein RmuC